MDNQLSANGLMRQLFLIFFVFMSAAPIALAAIFNMFSLLAIVYAIIIASILLSSIIPQSDFDDFFSCDNDDNYLSIDDSRIGTSIRQDNGHDGSATLITSIVHISLKTSVVTTAIINTTILRLFNLVQAILDFASDFVEYCEESLQRTSEQFENAIVALHKADFGRYSCFPTNKNISTMVSSSNDNPHNPFADTYGQEATRGASSDGNARNTPPDLAAASASGPAPDGEPRPFTLNDTQQPPAPSIPIQTPSDANIDPALLALDNPLSNTVQQPPAPPMPMTIHDELTYRFDTGNPNVGRVVTPGKFFNILHMIANLQEYEKFEASNHKNIVGLNTRNRELETSIDRLTNQRAATLKRVDQMELECTVLDTAKGKVTDDYERLDKAYRELRRIMDPMLQYGYNAEELAEYVKKVSKANADLEDLKGQCLKFQAAYEKMSKDNQLLNTENEKKDVSLSTLREELVRSKRQTVVTRKTLEKERAMLRQTEAKVDKMVDDQAGPASTVGSALQCAVEKSKALEEELEQLKATHEEEKEGLRSAHHQALKRFDDKEKAAGAAAGPTVAATEAKAATAPTVLPPQSLTLSTVTTTASVAPSPTSTPMPPTFVLDCVSSFGNAPVDFVSFYLWVIMSFFTWQTFVIHGPGNIKLPITMPWPRSVAALVIVVVSCLSTWDYISLAANRKAWRDANGLTARLLLGFPERGSLAAEGYCRW